MVDNQNFQLLSELIDGQGFSIFPSVPKYELDVIWKYVKISFAENFSLNYLPSKEEIINFHKIEMNSPKNLNLSVLDRTLNKEFSEVLSNQEWLKKICLLLDLMPADVHSIGHSTFTWRFTRPQASSDFRPLHRDSWFRTINQEPKIIDKTKNSLIQTVKIWIALNVVPGKSGLLVAPHSQKSKTPGYSVVESDGYLKPLINSEEVTPNYKYADTPSGSFIVFGEDLLHGGAPNDSNECRLSLEIPLAPLGYKAMPYFKY